MHIRSREEMICSIINEPSVSVKYVHVYVYISIFVGPPERVRGVGGAISCPSPSCVWEKRWRSSRRFDVLGTIVKIIDGMVW